MGGIALTQAGVIDNGDQVTNWVGDTFSQEPDIKVEGLGSVSCAQTQNGLNTLGVTTSLNLSGRHVRLYWNVAYVAYFAPTNPVAVYLSDGSNKDVFTYFTASSDYAGGWVDLVVACNATNFPTVNLAAITEVGVDVTTAAKPRNVPANCWLDNWRYSNDAVLFSSAAEPVSLADAAADDALQVAGILTDTDGVIFAVGGVFLGNDSNALNFVSVNETLVFPDRYVDPSLYTLSAGGAATIDIDVSGLVCKTVGANKATVQFDKACNSFSLVSSSFIDMGNLVINPATGSPVFSANALAGCGTTSIGINASSVAWAACDSVTSTAGVLSGCRFTNHIATGVFISSLDNLDGCEFVSPGTGHGADLGTIASNQSMTWNSEATGYAATDGSTGNETVRVTVNSGVTLTINNEGSGLSVKNDGPGTVNVISGAVTVRVVAQNRQGQVIEGARCLLKRVSDDSTILTGLTDANGVIEDTAYQYQGDEAVTGWVRRSTDPPLYKEGGLGGSITSSGYNTTAILIRDDL